MPIKSDTIAEYTAEAGVTIDGVLIKDGLVSGVNLGNAATGIYNVLDYGASPSASAAVNTAAIQAAINALAIEQAGTTGDYAGTLQIPAGAFEIDDTLTFEGLRGFKLIGTGGASRIIWTANEPTKPVIDILYCRNSFIGNMSISCSGGSGEGALALIRIANNTGATPTPRFNHFQDLWLDYGLYNIYIGGTDDQNNDFMQFENIEFNNYVNAGLFLNSQSQAYNYLFLNAGFNGNGSTSKYGIDCGASVGAGFTFIGGHLSGHITAALRLARSAQPYVFNGVNEEGNKKFLVCSADLTHVELRNCRLSASGVDTSDYTLMTFSGLNHLTIENCVIGDGLSPTPALKVAKVAYSSGATTAKAGRFVFNNNLVFSTLDGSNAGDWPFENGGSDGEHLPTEANNNTQIIDITDLTPYRMEPLRRATEYVSENTSFISQHGAALVIRARTTGATIDYGTFTHVPPYHIFTVICDGANTFYNHATATYGDNLYLAGNTDVTMSNGSSITFYYDYDYDRFIEISRSVH